LEEAAKNLIFSVGFLFFSTMILFVFDLYEKTTYVKLIGC